MLAGLIFSSDHCNVEATAIILIEFGICATCLPGYDRYNHFPSLAITKPQKPSKLGRQRVPLAVSIIWIPCLRKPSRTLSAAWKSFASLAAFLCWIPSWTAASSSPALQRRFPSRDLSLHSSCFSPYNCGKIDELWLRYSSIPHTKYELTSVVVKREIKPCKHVIGRTYEVSETSSLGAPHLHLHSTSQRPQVFLGAPKSSWKDHASCVLPSCPASHLLISADNYVCEGCFAHYLYSSYMGMPEQRQFSIMKAQLIYRLDALMREQYPSASLQPWVYDEWL